MKPADFIGPAGVIAGKLSAKASRLKAQGGVLKLLFTGGPGLGKTAVARMLAEQLQGNPLNFQAVNGRSLTVEMIRGWQESAAYRPVFSGFTVKLVDELDTAPPAAQDLLLTYLDEMKEGHAFLATSNMDLVNITPRLQSRLQSLQFKAPGAGDIAGFLREKNPALPGEVADAIASGCGGNVRAALLDLETWEYFR
jgi:replication-associated recombination protein RarA